MKKLTTIAVAMTALFFVSASATAQSNQYDRNDDQSNWGNNNGQYEQRNTRVSSSRPSVTIVIGANAGRGYNRPVEYRRHNDRRRYNDHRRYSRNNRYDRYDRNRGCEAPRRRGY